MEKQSQPVAALAESKSNTPTEMELRALWDIVKNDPSHVLNKFRSVNELLLIGFIAQLYKRNLLDIEDWKILAQFYDLSTVSWSLINRRDTAKKYRKEALDKLAQGIQFSTIGHNLKYSSWTIQASQEAHVENLMSAHLHSGNHSLWFA